MGKIIGERVVALRERRAWSQGQLLVQVKRFVGGHKLSRITISRIENDKYDSEPGIWIVEALARALNTSTDYLLGLTDDPRPRAPEADEAYPIPLPDVAPLVARLNALPEDRRQEAVNTFLSILDFSELEEDELMRDPQVRRFIELMDQLSEEQQDEAVAKLEEMVARHMNAERAAKAEERG